MGNRPLRRFAALVFILFLALSVACGGETGGEEEEEEEEGSIAPVEAVVTVDMSTDDDLHLVV